MIRSMISAFHDVQRSDEDFDDVLDDEMPVTTVRTGAGGTRSDHPSLFRGRFPASVSVFGIVDPSVGF